MDDSTIIETSHVILPKEDISNFIDFLGDEEPEESMPECVYQDEEPFQICMVAQSQTVENIRKSNDVLFTPTKSMEGEESFDGMLMQRKMARKNSKSICFEGGLLGMSNIKKI